MHKRPLLSFMRSGPACILSIFVGSVCFGPSIDAASLQESTHDSQSLQILLPPTAEDMRGYRLNLATQAMRARIIPVDADGNPVIVDSETLQNEMDLGRLGPEAQHGWQINPGRTRFIVELADFFNIDRIFFLSTATGAVSVAAADVLQPLHASAWQSVTQGSVSPKTPFREDFPSTSARYLAFTFDMDSGGEISGLGASGEDSLAQVTTSFGGDPDAMLAALENARVVTPFDFAKLYSGASITHISSGNWQTANDMLDDDNTTSHDFAPAAQTLLVVDVGLVYRFKLFSMIFEPGGGELEVYSFNMLPAEILAGEQIGASGTDSPKSIDLPDNFFADRRPALSLSVEADQTRTRADLMNSEARYFLVRWQPQGIGNPSYPPFKVFNISIIGDVPQEFAALNFIPLGDFLVETATGLPDAPSLEAGPAELPPPISP